MHYRVIISHKQHEYIRKFPYLRNTSIVFDAPNQEDIAVCNELGYHPVFVESCGNRGHNRNAGLTHILDTYDLQDEDIIEFFDGDRFPVTEYSTEQVYNLLAQNDADCLLYTCHHFDARLEKHYVPLEGSALIDTGTLCNPFYSCGFSMSVSAIRKVMQFNHGFFFEPRFTKWGCEDQFMGLVCSNLGLRVAITCEIGLNGNVGGDSHMHTDYRESLQTYVDLIREHNLPIRN